MKWNWISISSVLIYCTCSKRASDGTIISNSDRNSLLILVFRFWKVPQERSRHVCWFDGGSSVERNPLDDEEGFKDNVNLISRFKPCSDVCSLDVIHISLKHIHAGTRGSDIFPVIPRNGSLQNGEDYFIYQFILFMTVSKRTPIDRHLLNSYT